MHPSTNALPYKSRSATDPSKSGLREGKSPLEMYETEINAFPSLSILGICGSIGTGKSYACSLLTSKINDSTGVNDETTASPVEAISSAFHIDTDSLAHGVYSPGSKAIDEIEEEFGSDVIEITETEDDDATPTKTVNRKNLGAIVFSDRSKMAVSIFISSHNTI